MFCPAGSGPVRGIHVLLIPLHLDPLGLNALTDRKHLLIRLGDNVRAQLQLPADILRVNQRLFIFQLVVLS